MIQMKHRYAVLMWVALGVWVIAAAPMGKHAPKGGAGKKPAGKSAAWKIQNATSAAPKNISKDATVVDFPASEGADFPVLRKGTNGWTCLPDDPSTPANDPMCLDDNAMAWADAWIHHKTPTLKAPGFGYMLQGGGSPSNSDPYAKKPAEGEKWMHEAPHVMFFPVNAKDLDGYSTDPMSGKPWAMWSGTDYVHLMIPVK